MKSETSKEITSGFCMVYLQFYGWLFHRKYHGINEKYGHITSLVRLPHFLELPQFFRIKFNEIKEICPKPNASC